MKLTELKEAANLQADNKPIFAWLAPSSGPNNIRGVRLAYVQPLEADFTIKIKNQQEKADKGDARAAEIVQDLIRTRERYREKGQTAFTPDLGWWMNEEDFHAGKDGFGGASKGQILAQFPNIEIVSDSNEAHRKAEEAGLI